MIRWSPARPMRPSCPHGRLLRLLARILPSDIRIETSRLKPWASANFIGARHLFLLNIQAPDGAHHGLAAALQSQLGAAEWPLSGHIVADCAVSPNDVGDAGGLRLEMLTVEN